MTEPMKLSHSQLNGWATCGHRYYLERVARVPQVPAWNLIGGSAVHEATEQWDKQRLGVALPVYDFEEIFARLTADAEDDSGRDRSTFRATGRASKEWPEKENDAWWLHHGPAMVERWKTFVNNVPWDIWIMPDGTPAVELGFEFGLDPDDSGEPRVSLRGFIDRVFIDRQGNLIVVDLKTGASKQMSTRQLGTYRVGLQQVYRVDALDGAFWDARAGVAYPAPLNEYTWERLSWQYSRVRVARELNIFIPNPSNLCSSCSVQEWCYEKNPDANAAVRPPWVSPDEWKAA